METKSVVEESVPTEIPLETNVDEDLKPVKEEDDEYQEEINVTSIKRERPDEGIYLLFFFSFCRYSCKD